MYETPLLLKLYRPLSSFFELFKTAEFSRGLLFAGAVLVPLMITSAVERLEIGIAMAIGVLLTSPSDVPGSLRRRVVSASFCIAIAVVATLITGYALAHPVLFVPVLVLLIFHLSMISVFGFRASLISFSGLLAVVLGMAQVSGEDDILMRTFWIGMGGIWYLLVTLLLRYLLRQRETDQLLAEVFDLTARYLEVRALLMSQKCKKRRQFEDELLELQTSINEKHELIREMVITRRKNFGRSHMVRKRLLIFMELVDILELGMANPVSYPQMHKLFASHEENLGYLQEYNMAMAARLKNIAEAFRYRNKLADAHDLKEKRKVVLESFGKLETSAVASEENELLLIFRNFLTFKEKQYQKLQSIERLLKEWEGSPELKLRRKDAAKFLTTPEYRLKTLEDHLDFKSPIFRHSLRLTVVVVLGYTAGQFFALQNAYWILLTIIVIMRPGYALTRDRFKQRLYGTLIGGAVAVSLVFLIRSEVVYGILAVISLVLAHSMIQRNYKTAAAFITLNVVFVYSLLKPNVWEVIEFRVLDTAIGAGLALFGAKFLWPTWEFSTINNFIRQSIHANAAFIKEVELFYSGRSTLTASYRLARKKAFLAMGDLNAAFQRMAQEPKTEKSQLEETFRIVSLNQEFLSATASLGTFIRTNAITKASEHFENYMTAIQANLQIAAKIDPEGLKQQNEVEEAANYYENLYRELLHLEKEEPGKTDVKERLQEAQILMDRLKWLLELSEGLKKTMLKKA